MGSDLIRDLTDDEARAGLRLKWGTMEEPGYGADVLPAWVAEMDYALDPTIQQAVAEAVATGITGYSQHGTVGVAEALAGFAQRHWQWQLDPERVLLVADVMSGVRLAADMLSEPAPIVVPGPSYPPFLDVADITGKWRVDVPLDPDAARAELDLDRIDAAFRAGARTLLLCQPHNPWGRVFTRAELEGLRDVVVRHGARVISDEIHAPLVLDPDRADAPKHVSYLSLEGTADHSVVVISASKSFNIAGLKCAQVVCGNDADFDTLRSVSMVRNDGSSPLGIVGNRAAYTHGDPWLLALVQRLTSQRDLFAQLVTEHLPEARVRPMEATFLAWLDARAYGDDPAATALEQGRVYVNDGRKFGPGGEGHVRVNLATSPERLTEIVRRLAAAWT